MIQLSKVKIIKVGNSRYITVPARYIRDGNIDPTKCYDVTITKPKKA